MSKRTPCLVASFDTEDRSRYGGVGIVAEMRGRPDVCADTNAFKDGGIRGKRDRVSIRESAARVRDLLSSLQCEGPTNICMVLQLGFPTTL